MFKNVCEICEEATVEIDLTPNGDTSCSSPTHTHTVRCVGVESRPKGRQEKQGRRHGCMVGDSQGSRRRAMEHARSPSHARSPQQRERPPPIPPRVEQPALPVQAVDATQRTRADGTQHHREEPTVRGAHW